MKTQVLFIHGPMHHKILEIDEDRDSYVTVDSYHHQGSFGKIEYRIHTVLYYDAVYRIATPKNIPLLAYHLKEARIRTVLTPIKIYLSGVIYGCEVDHIYYEEAASIQPASLQKGASL